MSDGVELKVDVSYPTDLATGDPATGDFPVLLTQTPYLNLSPKAGDYFVKRGYIYLTAHVRGTGGSGGEFSFFSKRDAKDGAELVNWAARSLKGSNGSVGLHGNSYMGLTQFFTIAELGAGSPVKAMIAGCAGAEFYRETYYSGGIPNQTLNFQRAIGGAMGPQTAPSGAALVEEIEKGGERAYFGQFWKERTPGDLAGKIAGAHVPILLWSSDGDIYAQSSLDLYAYLQNAQGGRPIFGPMPPNLEPTGRYQILISQGGHCANQDESIQLEWFETWLRDRATHLAETQTPIHAQELVSNRWINTSHYPIVQAYKQLFLADARSMSLTAPTPRGADELAWGPPSDLSRLVYDSPVFPQGATLAGPMSASIVASSTTRNLELIVSLQLVAADGAVTPLTSGAVLGSLSENIADRSWRDAHNQAVRPYGAYDRDRYTPAGRAKRYEFAISPRFVHVPAGSRIRAVFTTQTPIRQCSASLGTDPCFLTAPQRASLTGSRVTIYRGGGDGSFLNLPLLPAECWPPSGSPVGPMWDKAAPVSHGDSCG